MLCRNKVRRSSQFLNELIQSKPIARRLEQIMDKESESKNKIHNRRIKIYGKKPWDSSIQIKSKPLKKISSDWIKLGKRSNKKTIPMLSNVIDLLAPNKSGGSYSKSKELKLYSDELKHFSKQESPNTPDFLTRNLIINFTRKRSHSRGRPSALSKYVFPK